MLSAWLKSALDHSGLKQAELGRRFAAELGREEDRSVIHKMLKGIRRIHGDELLVLSRVTSFPPPEIDLAATDGEPKGIPIVGSLGARAAFIVYDDRGRLEYVPMVEEASEQTKAIVVEGDALGEVFVNWLVYFNDEKHRPDVSVIGELCVVQILDGRRFVRKVVSGNLPGRFTLLANVDPPIHDVEIEWAEPVISLRRR